MIAVDKPTILCVDDEVHNVDALERLLRRTYKVLKATSGDEALALLKENKVSLIISDQRMPKMTGVEFLAESIKLQPEAIRMLLTGYSDIESVIDAINSGQIYRYVTKPWEPQELVAAVDRAVERYQMAQELKEKNAALEKALAELQTLDEAKTNFMLLISHELKTPLTSVISFLDLLKESPLDEMQTKFAQRIGEGTERLHKLVFDVLDLMSAETGQSSLSPQKIELKGHFEKSLQTFQKSIAEKGLQISLPETGVAVQADLKVLDNITERLLDNACKFADKDSPLVIHAEVRDDQVTLQIKNQGPQVSAEKIEQILKPFTLDENIMHHSGGLGLGLSICQAQLKRHGSELKISSNDGTFEVSFTLIKS